MRYFFLREFALATVCLAIHGCVAGGTRSKHNEHLSADVDPTRAFLALNDIEPVATDPPRAARVKPLSDRAAKQISKADELIRESRFTEAAIELERALRYDPKHPDIHRVLANLHWKAGNIVRARTHATRALEIRPDDATAHYILGRAYLMTDDPAAGMLSLRTAMRCSDFDEQSDLAGLCHFHLAEVLAAQGYLQAALDQYSRARAVVLESRDGPVRPETASLRQSNCLVLRNASADLLEKLGRFAEAATELEPLVEDAPDDVTLGCRYARMLMQAGRFPAALAAARRLPIGDDVVFELLYKIHEVAGHGERVVDDLRAEMAKRPDDRRPVLHLADIWTRLGDTGSAVQVLRNFLNTHPDDSEVRALLFDSFVAQAAWSQAIAICAVGIDRDPSQAESYETKIVALSDDEEAVSSLMQASVKGVSATEAYLRGVVAGEARRNEDADKWLRAAYTRTPDSLPTRVAFARHLLQTNRYDEAIRICRDADHQKPRDARLEFVLGRVYERLDQPEEAASHFQAAIQLDRTFTEPMLELAALYQRTGERLRARRQLNVLLDEHPDHEAARELLVTLHLEEGKLDVAVEQLETLLQKAKTPLVRARCSAFLEHVKHKDMEAYRQTLLDAMEEHGADAETWIAVAQSYGDPYKEAEPKRRALQRALRIDPQNEQAMLGIVEVSRRLLLFEEATEQLRKLLRRRPNRHSWRLGYDERSRRAGRGRSEHWYGLIELYWVQQDYESALKEVGLGLTRDDLDDATLARYRRMKIDTLRGAGREEEALLQLKSWVALEKDNRHLARTLAAEYLRQEQPAAALPILEAIHEESPSRRTLSNVIRTLVAAKRYERATQYLLDWLNNDPANDSTISLLADVLSRGERVDDALELIRNHLLQTIDREGMQSLMIILLRQAKRFDKALTLIESLLDEVVALLGGAAAHDNGESARLRTKEQLVRLPNEPFSAQRLHDRLQRLRDFQINVLIEKKEYRAARTLLVEWLDVARGSDERFGYLNYLAFCHRGEGNEEKANEVLLRALLLRPDHVTLNNDVAYSWIDRGVRIDEAEQMIRYALAKSPLQSSYLDTYGWLLYKKGLFQDARTWLVRANAARRNKDPVILDHLGDTQWRLGASDRAVESWKAALAASNERKDGVVVSKDEERVQLTVEKKIEAADKGDKPNVAALAGEKGASDDRAERGRENTGGSQ